MVTTPPLPAGTWTLDTSTTTVTVSAKKLVLFTVPATFSITSGSIEIDDSNQVVSVDVVADASTYASKNPKRNQHVLGKDFLDADNHPTIEFEADRVASDGSGFTAGGTVNVKGQSFPLNVAISDVEVDGITATFSATATVDRSAIGVGAMPDFVIGKHLQLTVAAQATQQA